MPVRSRCRTQYPVPCTVHKSRPNFCAPNCYVGRFFVPSTELSVFRLRKYTKYIRRDIRTFETMSCFNSCQTHRGRPNFSNKSTALEVAEHADLDGRYAIVTGGNSGIGLRTVEGLWAGTLSRRRAARNKLTPINCLTHFSRRARHPLLPLRV